MTQKTPQELAELSARAQQVVVLTTDSVRAAVAEGIKVAVSDPEIWLAAMKAMQHHAQTEAGGWLFSGLKAMLSRAAWVVVIGMGIYLIGGWSALVAFFKTGGSH